MELPERVKRYRTIEEYRKRPLIVYATSTRSNAGAMMAADVVRQFIDQIDAIKDGKSVDILIHSSGGDALTSWKLMSILRERFKSVAVLVPYMAFSAATIFALGADEIVMHPHASLGPIDPQITIRDGNPGGRRFSFEDVGAFLRFVSDEIGLSEQAYLSSVVEKLFSVVDPVHIGGAKRASELSTDVGERLLQMHMTSAEEKVRARAIAEGLNKTFFAHGDAVSRSRARALSMKVAKDDGELERLMWDAYLGLESYMELRSPFKPLEHFLANGGAAALRPTAPLVLPPNAPGPMAAQVWNQVAQAALQNMAQPAVEVEYVQKKAVVESVRTASEFVVRGGITAARVGGGEIQLSVNDKQTGWADVVMPVPGEQTAALQATDGAV